MKTTHRIVFFFIYKDSVIVKVFINYCALIVYPVAIVFKIVSR